jgi:hypothetical protein
MPIALRRTLLPLCVAVMLASCSKDEHAGETRMPTGASETGTSTGASTGDGARTPSASAPPVAPAPKPAPTSYACTGGGKVELGYLVARVTLPDGRTEQISRDPDDAAHFGSGAMEFRSRGDTGALTQAGRTVTCAGD